MAKNTFFCVAGLVTQDRYVRGRTLAEIERLLGFQSGRFSRGVQIVALTRLPELHEFELFGYTQVAKHRYRQPSGLDLERIKRMARESWSSVGPRRLVKVRPAIRHDASLDNEIQYPPGLGVPQWNLTVEIRAALVAELNRYPDERYL